MIDEGKLRTIIVRIIGKEKDNYYSQDFNDRKMINEIKKIIEGELR